LWLSKFIDFKTDPSKNPSNIVVLMAERMHGLLNRWVHRQMIGWTAKLMDGWMNRKIVEWKEELMDWWIDSMGGGIIDV